MANISTDFKPEKPAQSVEKNRIYYLFNKLWIGFASYCRHQGLSNLSAGMLAQAGTTKQDVAYKIMQLSHSQH